jgi:hypothetical protein
MAASVSARLVLVLGTSICSAWCPATAVAQGHACNDPCLQAARGERRDCAAAANDTYVEALGGCLERNHQCVDACRSSRQDCRDGTELVGELVACEVTVAARKDRCRGRFPIGSRRREICIDRAEAAGSRCRAGARRGVRRALSQCRAAFDACTNACGAGMPPEGVSRCRADAKAALQALLSGCGLTYRVTASGCIAKDVTCVQGCSDARDACTVPVQASRDTALGACRAEEASGLASCGAANPGGGASFDQCVGAVRAGAFTCRDGALDAVAPGLAACAAEYVGCVRACPGA